MKIFKIICIGSWLFCSFNIFSMTYDYQDEAAGITSKQIVTKEEIVDYSMILAYLFKLRDKNSLYQYSLNDALMCVKQVALAVKDKIRVKLPDFLDGFISYMEKSNAFESNYFKYLYEHDIELIKIYPFLANSIKIQRLHTKTILKDFSVSRMTLSNYFNYTNNYKNQCSFYSYFVLQIKLYKSRNKALNLFSSTKLFELLTVKNNVEEAINYARTPGVNARIKFLKLNRSVDHYKKIRQYFKTQSHQTLIGPVYKNNKIYFFKIIKKMSNFLEDDIDIKVKHYFLRKTIKIVDEIDLDESRYNINNLKRVIIKFNKNEDTDFLDKHSKVEYLNKKNANKNMYDAIKGLKKHEFSDVLEFEDGWHLFRVLDKEYNSSAVFYQKLLDDVTIKKMASERKRHTHEQLDGTYVFLF
ncbi:MAG TPA: hypothetical protein V7792_00200 [Candidatus Azoamicus sp. OHIO2]